MYYTFYFLDGKKSIVTGTTEANAFSRLGGGGLISAVDFYRSGIDFTYRWDEKTHDWIHDPVFEVDLYEIKVNGIDIQPFHLDFLEKSVIKEYEEARKVKIRREVIDGIHKAFVNVDDVQTMFDWKLF